MNARSVTVEQLETLYLQWNGHIDAVTRYRRALFENLGVNGVDRDGLRKLLKRAQLQADTPNDIVAKTDRCAALQPHTADTQRQPSTAESTTG
jgi:hypothetical protein